MNSPHDEAYKNMMMARSLGATPEANPVNRETVVFKLYHELIGFPTTQVGAQFDRRVENAVQPYQRLLPAVGPEWMLIDSSWIPPEIRGRIVIENRTGVIMAKQPSLEEAKIMAAQNLLLTTDQKEWWVIPPKDFFTGIAGNIKNIWIRAENTPVPVLISILPR